MRHLVKLDYALVERWKAAVVCSMILLNQVMASPSASVVGDDLTP